MTDMCLANNLSEKQKILYLWIQIKWKYISNLFNSRYRMCNKKVLNFLTLCTYKCKSRAGRGGGGGGGSAGKGRGFDAYPPVGLLIVRSDPGIGTFDFDRQKPGINSEPVPKSVPRGFLKVTLLEKGVKFSFVLILRFINIIIARSIFLEWFCCSK